jgi:hypothetical protein
MELTVAFMPAARISATQRSMAAWGRCVNSLWSMAMSHSRPPESRARRARHRGLDLGQHLLHARVVAGARGGILLVYF